MNVHAMVHQNGGCHTSELLHQHVYTQAQVMHGAGCVMGEEVNWIHSMHMQCFSYSPQKDPDGGSIFWCDHRLQQLPWNASIMWHKIKPFKDDMAGCISFIEDVPAEEFPG